MTSLHEVNGLAAPPTDAPVVADAHHHLWDLSALRYPWLQDRIVPDFMLGDYSPLRRDYLPRDYLADAKGCRVIATVHCEAEADRADPVAETRWLAEQHRRFGFPNALVVHADFAASDCRDTLHRHLEASPLVRGVRCKPQLPSELDGDWRSLPGGMADERWLSGLAALEPLGLSWDLRVPWRHLEAAASIAGRFPGITMVVNHTGLPWDRSAEGLARWRSGLMALATHPNVYLKISELGLKNAPWSRDDNRPIVRAAMDAFGPSRCLFASNYPVSGLRVRYGDWVNQLRDDLSDLTDEERDDFFWRNTLRVYRIVPSPSSPDNNRALEI